MRKHFREGAFQHQYTFNNVHVAYNDCAQCVVKVHDALFSANIRFFRWCFVVVNIFPLGGTSPQIAFVGLQWPRIHESATDMETGKGLLEKGVKVFHVKLGGFHDSLLQFRHVFSEFFVGHTWSREMLTGCSRDKVVGSTNQTTFYPIPSGWRLIITDIVFGTWHWHALTTIVYN